MLSWLPDGVFALSRHSVDQRVMSPITWKFNRLRTMGVREITYRVQKAAQAQWERRGYGLARPSDSGEKYGRAWQVDLPCKFDLRTYLEAADRLMAGCFGVFALIDAKLGFPPQWNRDCLSGKTAPMTFGKTLNYRDQSLVGNIKYLWEPNRHLELVTLAQAYHLTKYDKYAFACRILLQSWFDQCAYPLGPNWTSSLELAVRLLNWAFAWQLLGGVDSNLFKNKDGENFKIQWLTSIYQHCHFIKGHLSRHSSANNHLFGEYMGLFVGATIWQCWEESIDWQTLGQAGLEEEALKQNAPDGCNREQGIWYHHEVADMMLLSGMIGRANGVEFSSSFWKRLELMLDFIASVMDMAGNVSMIGDSDDAVMVRFVPEQSFQVYESLLASGAVLFNRPDFAAKAKKFDEKCRWLLGDESAQRFSELLIEADSQPLSFRRDFAEGGYYILGKDFETDREVKLIADAGPLGYLSIAAHGHADALAIWLSIGGREFLVDPGSYAYHTEREWRDYFKGTSAHNTVRIDRHDQSVSGGNFMWIKHANAQCKHFALSDEQDVFEGMHDGYRRLKDPVTHERKIVLEKTASRIEVYDRIVCRRTHFVELFWHFAESCSVEIHEQSVFAVHDNVHLEITMPEAIWRPILYIGDENLPLGWLSRSFDRKAPAPTIVWAGEIDGTTVLSTHFRYFFEQ